MKKIKMKLEKPVAGSRDFTFTLEKVETRAISATFRPSDYAIDLELVSGVVVSIPCEALTELGNPRVSEVEKVELTRLGGGLYWQELDIEISISKLLDKVFKPGKK